MKKGYLVVVFSVSKRVKTVLFLRYLADQFRTLAHLNMIKNRQWLDENHCSHQQQTPQLKKKTSV